MASTQTQNPNDGDSPSFITRLWNKVVPAFNFFNPSKVIQKEIAKIDWAKHLAIPLELRKKVHRSFERVPVAPKPGSRFKGLIMKRIPFVYQHNRVEAKPAPLELEVLFDMKHRRKRQMTNNDHCGLRWDIAEDGTVTATQLPVLKVPHITLEPWTEPEWATMLVEARATYADHIIDTIQLEKRIPYEDLRRIRENRFSQLVPSKRPSDHHNLDASQIRQFNELGTFKTIRDAVPILLKAKEHGIIQTDLTFSSVSDAQHRFSELCDKEHTTIVREGRPSLQEIMTSQLECQIAPKAEATSPSADIMESASHKVDEVDDDGNHDPNLTSPFSTFVEPPSAILTPTKPATQKQQPADHIKQEDHAVQVDQHKDRKRPADDIDEDEGPHTPRAFKAPRVSELYQGDKTVSDAEKKQGASDETAAVSQSTPARPIDPTTSSLRNGERLSPELLTTPIRVHLLQHEQNSPVPVHVTPPVFSPVIPKSALAKRESLDFGDTSHSFTSGLPAWACGPLTKATRHRVKEFNRSRHRDSMPSRTVRRSLASRASVTPTKSVAFEDNDTTTVGLTQKLRFDQSVVEHASPESTGASPQVDNAVASSPAARSGGQLSPFKFDDGQQSSTLTLDFPVKRLTAEEFRRLHPPTPRAFPLAIPRDQPVATPRDMRVVDVDARNQPDIFASPRKQPNVFAEARKRQDSIEKLAQVVEDIKSYAKVDVKEKHGRLIVRFKMSADLAHLFPQTQGDDDSNFSSSQLTTGSPQRMGHSRVSDQQVAEDIDEEAADLASPAETPTHPHSAAETPSRLDLGPETPGQMLPPAETPSRLNPFTETPAGLSMPSNPNVTMRSDTSRSIYAGPKSKVDVDDEDNNVPQTSSPLPSFREFSVEPATPTHLKLFSDDSPKPKQTQDAGEDSIDFVSNLMQKSIKSSPTKGQLIPRGFRVPTPKLAPSDDSSKPKQTQDAEEDSVDAVSSLMQKSIQSPTIKGQPIPRGFMVPTPKLAPTPRARSSLAPPDSSPAFGHMGDRTPRTREAAVPSPSVNMGDQTLRIPDFAASPSEKTKGSFTDSPGAQIANEIEFYSPKKADSPSKGSAAAKTPGESHPASDGPKESRFVNSTLIGEYSDVFGKLSPRLPAPAIPPSSTLPESKSSQGQPSQAQPSPDQESNGEASIEKKAPAEPSSSPLSESKSSPTRLFLKEPFADQESDGEANIEDGAPEEPSSSPLSESKSSPTRLFLNEPFADKESAGGQSPNEASSGKAAGNMEVKQEARVDDAIPTTPRASSEPTQGEKGATTAITFTPVNRTGKSATPPHSERKKTPEQSRPSAYQMTQEEIEQRDYMSSFLNRHRENSRNKRSATTETGSPVATKRQPLGAKSPNTPSPARTKRKADEMESNEGSPQKKSDPQSPKKTLQQSPKRGRRTAKPASKAGKAQGDEIVASGPPKTINEDDTADGDELAGDEGTDNRRSTRLKTNAPKSSIPTAIKVGRAGSVLKGPKTGEHDSVYQTRANTRKNRGASEYPTEVLARMSSQEKSDEDAAQDDKTTVMKKKGAKNVMWKTPLESHHEHEEAQEEAEADRKPKTATKVTKKAPKTKRQPKTKAEAATQAEELAADDEIDIGIKTDTDDKLDVDNTEKTDSKSDKASASKPKGKGKGKATLGASRIAKPAASKLPAKKKTASVAAQALGMVANGTPAKPRRVLRPRTKKEQK